MAVSGEVKVHLVVEVEDEVVVLDPVRVDFVYVAIVGIEKLISKGNPCTNLKCAKCGATMTREG